MDGNVCGSDGPLEIDKVKRLVCIVAQSQRNVFQMIVLFCSIKGASKRYFFLIFTFGIDSQWWYVKRFYWES